MQEGSLTEGPAVSQRRYPIGGIEDQLDPPVLDPIDDVRAAFQHFIDLFGGDAVLAEIALGSTGRRDLEAEFLQQLDRVENARFVAVAYRHEHGSAARDVGTSAELTLGERDIERPIEPHHL